MQPTIRRAEYKQFLRPDHFLACRYGCRHSTAAASNAGHLTCSTYGENSGRTVTDRTQEAQGQHGLTAMGTRGCDGTTDGRHHAVRRHRRDTAWRRPAVGTDLRTLARRLPAPRSARPNSGNCQAISPCTNVWPHWQQQIYAPV